MSGRVPGPPSTRERAWGDSQSSSRGARESLQSLSSDISNSSCDLYYVPNSDDMVLPNNSLEIVEISNLADPEAEHAVASRATTMLHLGTWRSKFDKSNTIDLRTLPRVVPRIAIASNSESLKILETLRHAQVPLNLKRRLEASQPLVSGPAETGGASTLRCQRTSRPLDKADTRPEASTPKGGSRRDAEQQPANNGLISLEDAQTLNMPKVGNHGDYKVTSYSGIASVALSEVYLGQRSKHEGQLVIKVARVRRADSSDDLAKSVQNNAEARLREYKVQKPLDHVSHSFPAF